MKLINKQTDKSDMNKLNIKTDIRKMQLKRIRRNYTVLSLIILALFVSICITTYINIRRNTLANNTIKTMSDTIITMENNVSNMIEPNNITLSKGTVMGIDTFEDTVTVIDTDGHAYAFYGVEDWMVKDGCIMLINDNGTDDRQDDVILDVLYDAR